MSYPLKDFLKSIKLEYEHESAYSEYFGIHGFSKHVPRIFRIANYLKKVQVLVNVLSPLIIVSFSIYFICHSIYSYLYSIFKKIITKRRKIKLDTIYLNTSNNRYFLNTEFSKEKNRYTVFNVGKYDGSTDSNSVALYEVTKFSDINNAFRHSLYTLFYFLRSSKRKLILYIYPAFRWYLVYFTLNTRVQNIWLSNHYDRWIGLADSLNDIDITMTQHGKLYFKDGSKTVFPDFSTYINNVSKIYLLDRESEYYFKKYIVSDFETILNEFNSKACTWPIKYTRDIKILVVGSQSQLHFQRQIIDYLLEVYSNKVSICYKYHPRQSSKLRRKNVWEVDDKEIIPISDIVITYGSTLDLEIEHLYNCKFLKYSNVSNEVLKSIKQKLDNYVIATLK